jgi:hypothetical protein
MTDDPRDPYSGQARPVAPKAEKPLMRSLGEFFGHIVHGIKTDPSKPAGDGPSRTVTKQTVEEETRQTPDGPVVLRRTIIEEVELPKPPAAGDSPR